MLLKHSVRFLLVLSTLYISALSVVSDLPSAVSSSTVIVSWNNHPPVSSTIICNTLAQELGVKNNHVSERDVLKFAPMVGYAFFNITEEKSEQHIPLSIHDCALEECQIMLRDHVVFASIRFFLSVQETVTRFLFDTFAQLVRYTPRFALLFTPRSGLWPQYIHRLVLCTIYGCFTEQKSVSEMCLQAKATLMRHLFRRCDFRAYQARLCRVFRRSVIFIIISLLPPLLTWIHHSRIPPAEVEVSDCKVLCPGWNVGGGRIPTFSIQELQEHIEVPVSPFKPDSTFKFISHSHRNVAKALYENGNGYIIGDLPLDKLASGLTVKQVKSVAKMHGVFAPSRLRAGEGPGLFKGHHCTTCGTHVSTFELHTIKSNTERFKKWYGNLGAEGRAIMAEKQRGKPNNISQNAKKVKERRRLEKEKLHSFPPPPPPTKLKETIIRNWCDETSPDNFIEAGCAVCGKLTPMTQLGKLSDTKCDLEILTREGMGITRMERLSSNDTIREVKGPVLDAACPYICVACEGCLLEGVTPTYALANGLWLGKVPAQLKDLTFAEQVVISRIRRNRCIVKVSSGMRKMKANAIMFENPMPRIYQRLPPPLEDLDEVLAFLYTGPCDPTEEDMERTPLLARRNKIASALEWLKLNHADYYDLDIAYDILETYPEHGPPVIVTCRSAVTNKDPEAVSAFDDEDEEGVESGPCAFAVHGLTGDDLLDMQKNPDAIKARAVKHLREDDGKMLVIGHEEKPESLFNNPTLYPMMFPWLFPYGLGGIGSVDRDAVDMSDLMHKRRLLMYHDKRFQLDHHFALVAFNQEQIKSGTTGGYLLTERRNFEDIADRLMNIDVGVLEDLSKRLSRGDRVKPETPEEKACYGLISDLDHVGGHVQGSITSKKYMRNEIWSLISYLGAPSWFITFAPADVNHPICLYYADTKETFSPELRVPDDCFKLIAGNPVAGARFFHLVVQMFIKHVLGVDQDHPGIYGNTSGYYGTVEQQGRLTLHLHLLLWISGSLSPQDIRDKIMDVNSDFQKKMVEYLESVCVGEFLTGSKESVSEKVKAASNELGYKAPTCTLPEPPPLCHESCDDCTCETDNASWRTEFEETVDDLLLRSNQHVHRIDKKGNDKSYCLNAKGQCKRRFPRETFEQTMVDPKTGALNMKKGEAWMNTVTPELTYLLRSNSDVTSLLSGTAIKAVVAYVTDYITKQSLKTYSVFDVVRSVIDKNSEMIGGDLKRREKVRKVFTQIVNSLAAKTEIGGPMASMYLLGNPDHYTGHKFVPFYWRGYVKEVLSAWGDEGSRGEDSGLNDADVQDSVVLNKNRGNIVGLSKVSDYVHRPVAYDDTSLYDWVRFYKKTTKRRTKKKTVDDAADDPEFIESESDDELNIRPTSSKVESKEDDHPEVESRPLSDFIEDDIGCNNREKDEHENDDEDEDEDEDDELDVMKEVAEQVLKKDRSFLSDHPQALTHKAYMKKEDPFVVPNFLPNTLPRSDRGDREYYCCTMLTMFKPWRTGKDLKSETDSWDKSFMAYEFTKRQNDIMKNFNVRYECLDARDDYSAQRDKDDDDKIRYSWATSDMLTSLDDIRQEDLACEGSYTSIEQHENLYDESLGILGKGTRSRKAAMASAERTMRLAGWLDECVDGLPDVGSLDPMRPDVEQPAKAWRAAVLAKKQEMIEERNKDLPMNLKSKPNNSEPNIVEIAGKDYIDRMFGAEKTDENPNLIDTCIGKFNLNTEQERAFRIIANHATMKQPEKLRMYLGGMGGTGKSQVIKALIYFFNERKESHRFIVVAPTGAAAALLNGSTYHSVLGINDGEFSTAKSLAQIRARLDGVDYIFLDEVSMLSCRDMYKISSQCAKARGVHEEPFGGINFIFAGDFAQLPPARSGYPLYSGRVHTRIDSSQSVADQESTIGKALWHQITTVVILRKNMRQDRQSTEDTMLRSALENMRYKSCTQQDIAFLRSRIAGKGPNDPKLAQKRFRNVSIITALNAQKDKINELGCERFAAENNQILTSFYSMDRWRDPEEGRKRKRNGNSKKLVDPVRRTNVLPSNVQHILWEQPHATSDKHAPGKLTLCVGMPVMLRHNDATECCITKGTEATVVGWQSIQGPEGQNVLDTLFVKLKNPPKTVKIDGLPENVVPLTRHSTATMCSLPNDDVISLSRDQVLVLPNFSMTDYASQGRTRPDNVVDLNNCRTHMSYYTCLSRSASAAGTIIVQGFDPKVITGGASGYLRQEFRELELLDEITKMRYERTLPGFIDGSRRNTIVRQFQDWKGTTFVPSQVHAAIRWGKADPFETLKDVTDTNWQIIENKKSKKDRLKKKDLINFIPAQGTVQISVNKSSVKKRKAEEMERDVVSPKRIRLSRGATSLSPVGLIWDGENYSCAYDALFTILLSVWSEDPPAWKTRFKEMNATMNLLASGFHRFQGGAQTLETARNKVRRVLNQRNSRMFPNGTSGTNIGELAHQMFRSDDAIASYVLRCTDCGNETIAQNDLQTCVLQCDHLFRGTVSNYLKHTMSHRVPDRCIQCMGEMDKVTCFQKNPTVLAFSVNDSTIRVSKKLKLVNGDEETGFKLKGVIYFGEFHFTSRIFTSDRTVWFHDGMTTARQCRNEGKTETFSDCDLMECNGKKATLLLYACK